MQWSSPEGDVSDSEIRERSPSTDGKEEDEDAHYTPPPSAKLHAMESNDEDCPTEMPCQTPATDGVPGSSVICERELRQHFYLPLHTAAQKFGICTTAFKKLCRRYNIAKWPHRQLRGIDKKIAALKAELNYTTGDRDGCTRSLKALRDEKTRISCSSGANAGDKLDGHASEASSPSSSPIISAADRANRCSSNHSLWQGGRCLTDDIGSASPRDAPGSCRPGPAAEELECAAALSMLAQLAGLSQESERAAAVAGLVRTQGLVSQTSFLGKRRFGQCSRASSSSTELDTPPLEPQLSHILSPLTLPFDKRACGSIVVLPPVWAPKFGAQTASR